jgi:hypothetical protein
VTEPENGDAEPRRWGVPARYPLLEGAGAVVFAIVAGTIADPTAKAVAGLAAILLAAFAVRDRVARIRLAADRTGLTVVHGYAGQRHFAWPEIEAVKIDNRPRFGVSRPLVEIDAGEQLYLFSRRELGEEAEQVVRDLAALRNDGS